MYHPRAWFMSPTDQKENQSPFKRFLQAFTCFQMQSLIPPGTRLLFLPLLPCFMTMFSCWSSSIYERFIIHAFLQAQRLGLNFREQLAKYGKGQIPVKEMVEKLMQDSVKADKSRLPGICSLDWEFDLSSVFVEVDTPLVNLKAFTTTFICFQ